MLSNKRYKYRLKPGAEVLPSMHRLVGCSRAIYNILLDETKKEYEEFKMGIRSSSPAVNHPALCSRIVEIKKREEYAWLSEVNAGVLQQSALDLAAAYANFFKRRTDFPTFKKKRTHATARFSDATRWKATSDAIKLEKIAGWIDCIFHRDLPDSATSCTITRDSCGDWYASFTVTVDTVRTSGERSVGIDLGLKNLAVTSDGVEIANPKHLSKKEHRLKRYQRAYSRKIKGSKNQEKARIRVAVLHRSIANSRLDYIHKAAKRLVDSSRVIAVETLSPSNMVRNGRLAKSLSDASFGLFQRVLEEKVKASGHCHLVKLDPFYPSTQTCSVCGYRLKGDSRIKLGVRVWTCQYCLSEHDRDINAARNIEKAGRMFLKLENQELIWSEESCIRRASNERIALGLALQ